MTKRNERNTERKEHEPKNANECSYEELAHRCLNDSISNFNYFYFAYIEGCNAYELTKEEMRKIWDDIAADFMGWLYYFNNKEVQ